jgi:hypothetical protein
VPHNGMFPQNVCYAEDAFVSFVAKNAAVAAAIFGILTACAGNANGVPSAASAYQQSSTGSTDAAKALKLSGEYTGTVKDSQHGPGKANVTLSQSINALGGSLSIASSPTVEIISWTASGKMVQGTSVFIASSGYCTFSNSLTYNTKTNTLTGSYKPVYGCPGETGTYQLKHRCYYKGSMTNDVRPETGPRPC